MIFFLSFQLPHKLLVLFFGFTNLSTQYFILNFRRQSTTGTARNKVGHINQRIPYCKVHASWPGAISVTQILTKM